MLCAVIVDHRSFCGVRRAVGMSMAVGIMIFSIVGGLGFGVGLSHGFVWWRLTWLGRCLLHRLRMLV